MQEIFEKEVFPIMWEIEFIKRKWFGAKKRFIENQTRESELNQLTIAILNKYKNR
jgi:hypothetical protein